MSLLCACAMIQTQATALQQPGGYLFQVLFPLSVLFPINRPGQPSRKPWQFSILINFPPTCFIKVFVALLCCLPENFLLILFCASFISLSSRSQSTVIYPTLLPTYRNILYSLFNEISKHNSCTIFGCQVQLLIS